MSGPQPHLTLPILRPHQFRNPRQARTTPEVWPSRDPVRHAAALRGQIDALAASWAADERRLPESRGRLATAVAAEGRTLSVDSLGDKRTEVVVVEESGSKALLHARTSDLGALTKKITAYGERRTRNGRPSNEPLVAPLEALRQATFADVAIGELASIQIEPRALYWVELWTNGGRLSSNETRERTRGIVETLVALSHPDDYPEPITFKGTERDIHLAQLSGEVLLELPVLAPDVYRVLRPAEARADRLARDYAGDLIADRPVAPLPADATAVAVLDTGVAEEHHLLRPLIDQAGVSVIPGEMSAIDQDGHGTELAGLAVFADLAQQLLNGDEVVARARLENVRCKSDDGDRALWAARTEEAVETAETFARRRRVFNLALSDRDTKGEPRTSWTASIDRIAHNGEDGRLICVAIGNAPDLKNREDYPTHNMSAFLHDPAPAANAITVGAVTHRDVLADEPPLQNAIPLARAGQLSPYASTNASSAFPIKPDIVMEGGNTCPDGALPGVGEPDLSVLTTSHRHVRGELLAWTWATSAACGAASGLSAEIWEANPHRTPQAIRALLVNAARWTPEICRQHPERRERLRAVGYGEPQRELALASTLQRPTVIVESSLAPDEKVGEARRGMQLVRLPLPSDELLRLGDHEVEVAVTLSFFGEPNEARKTKYFGATLAWDLQRRGETDGEFLRRVDDSWRPRGVPRPQAADEWPWEIGPDARSRGTVQSDRMRVTAASLANDKHLAVWPVVGWWDGHRERFGRARVRYSLVVTIDAGDADIDLYNLIRARIPISVPTSVDAT